GKTGLPAFRIGQGWDTHRLEAGRPLILGGIRIPSDFGLAGHSDADVLFHSVTDAIRLAADEGYRLINIDATIVLERPKLKDFRDAIRESLARATGIAVHLVSVKFKTAERVGPVGEGRSCEAQAVV